MRCNAASEDELREQLPYSNVSLHVCADPAPAVYLTQVAINQQWADMKFPNRSLKKIVKPTVVAAFEASKQTHRNNAAQRQEAAPAVYVLDTIYHPLLKEDKRYFATTRPLQ
jgi:hypothetical protein